MESKVTATLIVKDKVLHHEESGEKFYKIQAKFDGESDSAVAIDAIISEYLLPETECRTIVKFHIRTIKEPGEKLSTNYPYITECEVVADDAPTVNEAKLYGYITNMGALKTVPRLSENFVNLIVKYRAGVKPISNFVNLRAHGSLARRLVKEAKASDHIHVEGIISVSEDRITLDIKEIIAIQDSLTKKGSTSKAN